MLLPVDAALVRRDAALPGLALLLDPERLHRALRQVTDRHVLGPPVVTYLRYKPGQSCLAACRLELDGQSIDFTVKAYLPGAHHDKVRKAFARPSVAAPLGSGRFFLQDSAILVSVFPHDSKLETLVHLEAPDVLARLVRKARAAESGAAGARIVSLKYNPERRFVGALAVGGREVATVRCYTKDDYQATAAKAGVLQSRGPLRLARRRARLPRHRLLAFEWLAGDLLHDALQQGTVSPAAMSLVGAALVEVHAQAGLALPLWSGRSEAAAVLAMARNLGVICPDLAARAAALASRLAAHLANARTPARAIHGDFYAKQVLLQNGTAGLLDLDHASRGDPAMDLGRFCADLEANVIAGHLDATRVEACVGPLFEGYRASGGELPSGIDRHVAAALLRLTLHPFRLREPLWPERSAALLERAEAFLDRETRSNAPRVFLPGQVARPPESFGAAHACAAPAPGSPRAISAAADDPFGVVADPAMPFLATALDRHEMGEQFRGQLTCLDPGDCASVVGISVMRHKPGRRCLIAYELAAVASHGTDERVALVGKVRARGADTSTHRLLSHLWAGSFGPDADDGITVPEPVGVLADLQMVVQRRVPGEALTCLLEGSRGYPLARRAAEAIAKLHRQAIPAHRQHSVDDEIRILRERLVMVADSLPHWQTRITALLDGCERIA
ncbi:MAG: phosphotransferase, partial [Acidobacteriota bacterium]|nr:phosphotransferase [Acidobacteriota bacterium]